jgi:hypothetical protein
MKGIGYYVYVNASIVLFLYKNEWISHRGIVLYPSS